MLSNLINTVRAGNNLGRDEVHAAIEALVDEAVSAWEKAEFLSALATKGESVEEIAEFAKQLRDRSVRPDLGRIDPDNLLDVCGTGGDKLNTFNISTTVSLVAAAAGIQVAKHGNRAITSQSGSADVLKALGIEIDLPPEAAVQSLRDRGFAFFFAPNYHPAFKHIAPARKLCAENGQRTLFNFLGPLLNPTRPKMQLVGVPRPELCVKIAEVLQLLGVRRAMVVSGQTPEGSLDELSTLGVTTVAEFYQPRGFNTSTLDAGQFGFVRASLQDLKGGNAEENAEIVLGIIENKIKGPKRDAVVLNAGAALFVASKTKSLSEGMALAIDLIESGAVHAKLLTLREKIA